MSQHVPTIIRNPASDAAFSAVIDELLAAGVTDIDAFTRQLRERYPNVVVRPRDLAGESIAVWYVYRDGRWTNEGRPSEA